MKKELPSLYKYCRSTDLFSYKRYILWSIFSIVCAFWLFYPTLYVMDPKASVNERGNTADWISFSTNLEVTCCLVVMCVLAMDLQMYTWWTLFCIGGGAFFASFVVFIIENYAYIPTFDDCFWGFTDNFNVRFWCLVLVLSTGVIIPKYVFKAIQYEIFPD